MSMMLLHRKSRPKGVSLAFSSQPGAVVSGATMGSFAVEIRNKAGQRITRGPWSQLSITIAPTSTGGGALAAGGTLTVAAVAGVATFSAATMTLSSVPSGISGSASGNYSDYPFTLTATATGLTSATSSSFAVRWSPNELTTAAANIFDPSRGGVTAKVPVADFERDNGEYLSRADSTTFEFNGVNQYIAAWINAESYPAGNMGVFGKLTSAGDQREYNLFYSNGDSHFAYAVSGDGTAGTTSQATADVRPSTGAWAFLEAWHRNGVGIAIRINRGDVLSTAHVGGMFAGTSLTYIGAITGASAFDGKMALVGVTDQVTISGAGVGTPDDTISADLYNGGTPPLAADLDAATIAAFKRSGGASGDLLFFLAEHSAGTGAVSRVSHSGNFSFTDNNTVASVQGPRDAVAAGATGMCSQLDDIRGAANGSATNATAAQQPLYVPTGGANSEAVLRFDGTDDVLIGTAGLLSAVPINVWAVAKRAVSGATHAIWSAQNSTVTTDGFEVTAGDTSNVAQATTAQSGPAAASASGTTDTSVHLFEGRFASATSRAIRRDGASEGTNSTSKTPSGVDRYGLGANARSTITRFMNGDIAAVVVAAGTPSVGERNLVHDWLQLAHGGSYTPISA